MRVTLKQVKKVWADIEGLVTLECEPGLPASRRWRVCNAETFERTPWQSHEDARQTRLHAISDSVAHKLYFDTEMTVEEAEAWGAGSDKRRPASMSSKRECQRDTWMRVNDYQASYAWLCDSF